MQNQQELAKAWQSTSVLDLWHSQVTLHHQEEYKGIGLAKFPQDLWSYEKLITSFIPDVIIEIGVNQGGFTRWLYDRLLALTNEQPRKIRYLLGLDIDIKTAMLNLSELASNCSDGIHLELIECDLLDSNSLQEAKENILKLTADKSTLIIEDSGHTYETTKAALDTFSPLLRPGEWFIVEDTCVDINALRESPDWPRGALSAANDFLIEHSDFERTDFNHLYTITCHPFGFLKKTSN